MNRKKRKTNMLTMLFFAIGLVMYLTGIVLLFCSSLKNVPLLKAFFSNVNLTSNIVNSMKLVGGILFFVGFIIFGLFTQSTSLLEKSMNQAWCFEPLWHSFLWGDLHCVKKDYV